MMSKKTISYQLLAISLILGCYSLGFAQTVSSSELISRAKDYDGKDVTYAGEVIGDVMVRGQYAWINVNDGNNAVGVWLERSLAREIALTGNYQARGDWVEIRGIFQRRCLAHGGDLDIHAQSMRRIAAGARLKETVSPERSRLIIILAGILVLVWILSLFKRQ